MIVKVGGPEKAMEIQADKDYYSIDQYLKDYKMKSDRKNASYKMSSILADNDSKHNEEDNIAHVITAIELGVCLLIVHGGGQYEPHYFPKFAAMLVVDYRRIIYNVFGWTDWDTDEYVANCQCCVGSLINHSCVANVQWCWKDGVITFSTTREIQAGEEVTISYGPDAVSSYSSRQEVS